MGSHFDFTRESKTEGEDDRLTVRQRKTERDREVLSE